jgi:hypothetical protein
MAAGTSEGRAACAAGGFTAESGLDACPACGSAGLLQPVRMRAMRTPAAVRIFTFKSLWL